MTAPRRSTEITDKTTLAELQVFLQRRKLGLRIVCEDHMWFAFLIRPDVWLSPVGMGTGPAIDDAIREALTDRRNRARTGLS